MPKRNSNERLYLRGRVWWTWYFDNDGKRHDLSTKCRDRSAAAVRAGDIERAATRPAHATQAAATVGHACALYRTNKEKLIKRGKRAETSREFFKTKIDNVQRILERKGPLRLQALQPKHLDEYVELREQESGAARDSTVSAHTIKKELTAFKQALKLAQRAGIFAGMIDPLFPPDQTSEYAPRERALTPEEVRKLLLALAPDPSDRERRSLKDTDHAARIAFLVATGARWSGSDRALRSDVSDDLRYVRIRETKTATADRTVPIVTPAQQGLLRLALSAATGTERLFRPWENKSRDINAACKRAGIERCSPNDFRRTMALWLRAAKIPAEVVGMVLGHASARMVEKVYARLQRHPEDLRKLVEKHLVVDPDCSGIAAITLQKTAQNGQDALSVMTQVLDITAKP